MNYFKEIDRIIGDYGFIGNRRELITKVYNAGNPAVRDTMSKEVFYIQKHRGLSKRSWFDEKFTYWKIYYT